MFDMCCRRIDFPKSENGKDASAVALGYYFGKYKKDAVNLRTERSGNQVHGNTIRKTADRKTLRNVILMESSFS